MSKKNENASVLFPIALSAFEILLSLWFWITGETKGKTLITRITQARPRKFIQSMEYWFFLNGPESKAIQERSVINIATLFRPRGKIVTASIVW